MGTGDGTEVDLNSLTTYAANLAKLADDQVTWSKNNAKDMATTSAYMIENSNPMFSPSAAFHAYHQRIVNSAVQFQPEATQGTASLSAGAETAAINYASADQLGAFNMSKIQAEMKSDPSKAYEYMTPVFGGNSTAKVTTDDITTAFAPPTKDGVNYGDGSNGTVSNGSDPQLKQSTQDIATTWNNKVKTAQANHADVSGSLTPDEEARVYGTSQYTVPNTNVTVGPNEVNLSDVEHGTGDFKLDQPNKPKNQ